MIGVNYTSHFHVATGVNLVVEIVPEPPFVIITPEPIATVTDKADGEYFSSHEHEMVDLPSIDVSFSEQDIIGNQFMLHSHFFNSTGLSILPPGTFTMNVIFTPPPLDIMSKNSEYINFVKNDYIAFFNENVKVDGREIIVKNSVKDYSNFSWKNFINFYVKNNLEAINEKFENHR